LQIHLAHVSNARTKSADLLGRGTRFLSVFECLMSFSGGLGWRRVYIGFSVLLIWAARGPKVNQNHLRTLGSGRLVAVQIEGRTTVGLNFDQKLRLVDNSGYQGAHADSPKILVAVEYCRLVSDKGLDLL